MQKFKNLYYHKKVIKKDPGLIAKIISGYIRTLLLRQNVLRTVELTLLTECNSKCEMCYASKIKRDKDNYLTVQEYKDIWQQAAKLGAFSVVLSGGEPTLRKDLFDIITVMAPRHTIFALVTNALNLDYAFLSRLKKAGVETIHLSLDSVDEQTNDRIRGASGHFQKVMESIRLAKEIGLAVYISTVIMHNGLEKMREMVEFARKNKIGVVFSLACISGNWAGQEEVLLTKEEWLEVKKYMKANPFIRSDWMINFSMRQECPAGREKICISPYGDVMGCGMNFISFGNIRQEPLEKIWRRMGNFPDFRRRSADCLIGADSAYIEKFIKPISNLEVPVRIDKHPVCPISLEELERQ